MNNDCKSLVKLFFDLLFPNSPDISGAVSLLNSDVQPDEIKRQNFAEAFKKGLPRFRFFELDFELDLEDGTEKINVEGEGKNIEGQKEDIVISFKIDDNGKITSVTSNLQFLINPTRWPPRYP